MSNNQTAMLIAMGFLPHPDPQTKAEILTRLEGIEADLSPENLTCDGERSAAQVRAAKKKLDAEKAKLLKRLGGLK